MSPSKLPSSSRLTLQSRTGSIEIRVLDSNLNTVAKGFGSLDEELPPGLYQIEYRAGDRIDHEFVALRPDAPFTNDKIDLRFPTPVPLDGTSSSHEYYQAPVEQLSLNPLGHREDGSALMVFIRNPDQSSNFSLPVDTIKKWELVRSGGGYIPGVFYHVSVNSGDGWIGVAHYLEAGSYAIRTGREYPITVQAVELSPGWITGLFISNTEKGTDLSTASVQMRRLGQGWRQFDDAQHRIGRLVELALAGLREGRSVLPSDQLVTLLQEKFSDPILGIIGAHVLLLRQRPDLVFLHEVLDNLESLVPDHADVNALRHMSARFGVATSVKPQPVTWPPMFSASFGGVLRCDAEEESVIPVGSVAERIAPSFRRGSTWTTWLQRPIVPQLRKQMRAKSFGPEFSVSDIKGEDDPEANAPVIPAEVTARVKNFLDEAIEANDKGLLDELQAGEKISEIAIALGLPRSLTRRAIQLALGRVGVEGVLDQLSDFKSETGLSLASD